MTTAYDDAAALISSRKHFLFEVEPAEPIWNWVPAAKQSNTYWRLWSHLAQTDVIKGGIYRRLVGIEEDGTALLETDSITNVEANTSSYYYRTAKPATLFDGTTEAWYLKTTLAGAADAKFALFSCWFRKDGRDGITQRLLRNLAGAFRVSHDNNNKIHVAMRDTADASICNHVTDDAYVASENLYHVLVAIDQGNDVIQVYINDAAAATTGAALTDAEIAWDKGSWSIGANDAGLNLYAGLIYEMYATNEYLDISVEANRRKFISAEGIPVDCGNDGELPTGTAALIYKPVIHEKKNRGSGGDFVNQGSEATPFPMDRIYVQTSGTVDPDTLDMMAANFRLHFSTTGKTYANDTAIDARDFDNANDWYTKGAALTGVVDGTKFTFSCWFQLDGSDGSTIYLYSGANATPIPIAYVRRHSSNVIQVTLTGLANGRPIAVGTGTTTLTAGPGWHHVYISIDVTIPALYVYLDGVNEVPSPATLINETAEFDVSRYDIAGYNNGNALFDGSISELYVNYGAYLGADGYHKFRDAQGNPVPLGSTGENPTGTAPAVYCPDGDGSNNLGSGGDFTAAGSPTAVQGPMVERRDVYYETRILLGTEASVSEKSSDFVIGKARTASGVVRLANHDALFDKLVTGWSWKNRPGRFRFGLDDNAITDYITVRELVVDDISFTEQALAINLVEGIDTWLRRFPPTPHLGGTAFGEGVSGTRVPILIGVKTDIIPDLTDNEDAAANEWIYTIADGANQDLDAVAAVYAINKSTGARQTLTLTTHYTVDLAACTIKVLDAFDAGAEIDEVYEIRVDATGQPAATYDTSTDYLKYPGEIAHWILTQFLDLADGDLRIDTFTAADAEAPDELAFWIKDATNVRAVLRTLGVSVLGDIRTTIDGLIEFYLWTPWAGAADAEDFSDEDFQIFNGDVKIETVYYKTVVRYDEDPAHPGSFAVATATDDPSNYLVGNTAQIITVDTFLKDASAASAFASRINFLYRGINVEMLFEERGIRLMGAEKNTRIRVTKTRAPTSTGALTDRLMEIIELDKDLDAPSVSGRLADMRGLAEVNGTWTDDTTTDGDTMPVWDDATDEQKANSGFWTDANGLADAADQDSAGVSIWW